MGVRVEIHGLIASVDVAVTPCINKRNHRLSMLWGDIEALRPRRELLELHDVAGKRASLIREDVLNLIIFGQLVYRTLTNRRHAGGSRRAPFAPPLRQQACKQMHCGTKQGQALPERGQFARGAPSARVERGLGSIAQAARGEPIETVSAVVGGTSQPLDRPRDPGAPLRGVGPYTSSTEEDGEGPQ